MAPSDAPATLKHLFAYADESWTPPDDAQLVGAALALGAERVAGWSDAERSLVESLAPEPISADALRLYSTCIREGFDPLGDGFRLSRSPEARRPLGATYTPQAIVDAMVKWATTQGPVERVIDPGIGSGRFAVTAGRSLPSATIIGAEVDPLPAILARGNLAAAGLADRSTVLLTDYRSLPRDPIEGKTLYVGNPPYVRHHQIEAHWKDWLSLTARSHGHGASQLAGLHVHFFLATLAHGQPGDFGAFVTSAEWLDVNYGLLVRELLLNGLGGESIHVLEPTATPFEDAATTAAITCFRLGSRPRSMKLRRVKNISQLGTLTEGKPIRRERLEEARRWTALTRPGRSIPEGYVELGELCRVHRGAVTGSNSTWVVPSDWAELPNAVLYPTVTRARELFSAGAVLNETDRLRRVVDIPPDLDVFASDDRKSVERFLRRAKRNGVAQGYVAQNRRAWWSVGLRAPAPILATYMARRPPVFVQNAAEARHINIAHGLYPRQPLSASTLHRLAAALRERVTLGDGRTYAGGLTKFEPREMERLHVPCLELLEA